MIETSRFQNKLLIVAMASLIGLTSCGRQERILQGEREGLRAVLTDQAEDAADGEVQKRVDKLALAAPAVNSNWTHRNGSASHLIRHPALGRSLTKVWTVSIGSGNTRKHRVSSDPIVVGDRIYTMDAVAGVRAFSTGGALLWQQDLTPPIEKSNEASGGGISFGNGVLAATTGHGEVLALDPATGAIRWRHKSNGAISAAPVVTGNMIVAVGRNNVALGLDIKNGRVRWQQQSPGNTAGVSGAGAPAATSKLAVLPFASGEIVGAVVDNGLRAWSAAVTGGEDGIARGFVNDISGDPVIDGQTVYVANQAGRMASLDRRSGTRNWTAKDGSYTPVWPAGGAVFMITDSFAVKRLNASDGTEVWSAELPDFKAEKERRKRDTYAYFGPVLAGGQVWVAGSDGLLRSYNPADGALTGTLDLPGGAASQPAIAGGRMYILSANGQLHAYQ